MENNANFNSKTINSNEPARTKQLSILDEFFKTDSASEMIASLNALTEEFLFTERENFTISMRTHIVNQLRVVTLLAKLQDHA